MHDRKRKPDWLRVRAFGGEKFARVDSLLKRYRLNTVCRAANCPNRGECFGHGTATFLILGPYCTRSCRFCDVPGGKPLAPDPSEPERVAEAAMKMELKHVVITSVTRDDLPDGGAGQFVLTIRKLRELLPKSSVEVLTPDFKGSNSGLETVMEAEPDIFNHNLETVPRLYSRVRPGADYHQSLQLLLRASEEFGVLTKSGLMVGLGETSEELSDVFVDLVKNKVTMLTVGQYLSPSSGHLPVERYVPPDEFVQLEKKAREAGLAQVLAGPLVRSSYMAHDLYSSHRQSEQAQLFNK